MNSYLGEIILVAFGFAPVYWSTCAGQIMQINQNEPLFLLLGTRYGGDGLSTFHLPTLTAPAGMTYIIAIQGIYPTRE